MRLLIASILIMFAALPCAFADDSTTATMVIHITGFESDKGQVRIYVFKGEDGFPSKPDKAFAVRKEKIASAQLHELTLTGIPYGDYAVAVHHDENGNDKMDKNWMHIPKEPTGASNGARGSFGPPKWKKAKFEVAGPNVVVPITLK